MRNATVEAAEMKMQVEKKEKETQRNEKNTK